jgi:glycosyltransferase involved in cell wall biosynthesis
VKRKVVQIVRTPVGGIRKHILSIVEGLSDEYEMILILDTSGADSRYFDFINDPKNKRIKVYDLRILDQPGPRDLLNLFKVLLIMKNISPDVIHGHGAKGGLYARLVGFFLGIKVIYTAHGGSVHDMHGKVKNKIYSYIEKSLYYLTDLLVFESEYTMRQYSSKVGQFTDRFRLNYNAIEVNDKLTSKSINHFEESDRIVIGAFGLLRFIKGHDLLIPSVANLRKKGFDIVLNIFGEGEEKGRLTDLIKKHDMDNFIKIHNKLPSVDQEMKKCHLIAHPSRFESFGYVPLEAISNGASVVSTLEGGLEEVMDKGKSGFCTKEISQESIEREIEKAITNKDLREKKFSHAIEYMREKFSLRSFLDNLNIYYKG